MNAMHEPSPLEGVGQVAELLDAGVAFWPERIHEVDVDEDHWVLLLAGRRTFHPVYADELLDGGAWLEGDLIVFWPRGRRHSFPEPELRQITDVWTHSGIAPGWLLASFRPVKLVSA